MITIDTAAINQSIDLVDLASRYTELRRESSREFSGPCPRCGGTDRFHCKGDMWFCRQCYPLENNRPHDAIAFEQWINGSSFTDACNALSGGYVTDATPIKPAVKNGQQRAWNEQTQRKKAVAARNDLVAQRSSESRAALDYLMNQRMIEMDTIIRFRVGCRMAGLPATWDEKSNAYVYPKQLAVTFPWFDFDGNVIGMRYRFLEKHSYIDIDHESRENVKSSSVPGSRLNGAFGLRSLAGPNICDALLISEGELNAMSLWQAGRGRIDVISTGSESTTQELSGDVIDLAMEYKYAIIWADKRSIADVAAAKIGAASMISPVIDGYPNGADANDLLKLGMLEELIDYMLRRFRQPSPNLADLCDYIAQDVDAATWQAIQERAAGYGWTVQAHQVGERFHFERIHAVPQEN